MEKLLCLLMLMILIYCDGSCAEVKIQIHNPIYFGEPTIGSCVVRGLRSPILKFIRVQLVDSGEACSITMASKLVINHPYFTRNFTLTCTNNTRSVTIKCYAITVLNGIDRKQIDVVPKPKIVNKPANVTAEVGLPITLSCHVKGDPAHYWVGWVHRESTIEHGDQYAMNSTSSHYGTSHYLTVHTVKSPGQYECKVFTIGEHVEDHVTHQVNINEGNVEVTPEASSSSKLLNSLRSFLF